MNMNRIGLVFLMSLAAAGAYAQDTGGVTMSTDPAKAAAVESRAQELKARQANETAAKPAATHKGSSKSSSKSSSHAKSHSSTHTTHKSSGKPAKSSSKT